MSLSLLVENSIDKKLREIPQTLLATIETFDKETMRASVQPLYRTVDQNGNEKLYPLITKVPVVSNYLGNDVFIKPSFKRGDLVLIAFSTFDRTKQLSKVPSKEGALFGKENCFVIGGVKPSTDTDIRNISFEFEDDILKIKNGFLVGTEIQVSTSEIKVTIGGNETLINATGVKSNTIEDSQGTLDELRQEVERIKGVFNSHTHTTTGLPPSPTAPPSTPM